MRITMQHIAEACGVSKGLVSRVINNDPTLKIPDATRERIWNEIDTLGYAPDQDARALAKKHTMGREGLFRIGYITYVSYGKLGHPYFSHIIEGIVNEAKNSNCTLACQLSISQLMDHAKFYSGGQFRKLDGLILLGSVENRHYRSLIEKMARYYVCLEDWDNKRADIVGSDYKKCLTLGLDHLVQVGYDDIGMVVGNRQPRLEYLKGYFEKQGRRFNPRWIISGNNTAEDAYSAVSERLDTDDPPQALFCWNDEMAIGAVGALLDRGFAVPGRVAIVGHDDISMAKFSRVPLTTVKIFKKEIGHLAVRLLIDRIKSGRQIPVKVDVPPKLIVRESCRGSKPQSV